MSRKEKPEATAINCISVDLGNAYSNMRADGNVAADWRSIIGRVSDANRMRELPFDWTIGVDDTVYVFGDKAMTYAASSIEDFPTKDRYTSGWYRLLFTCALHKAYGLRLQEGWFYPKVIASIPASEFKIVKQVERIKANLIGEYCIQTTRNSDLKVMIKPENLIIIPEGAGSYYWTVKQDTRTANGVWMVLDLGYLTGDIVMFRDAEYIADKSASDSSIGVRKVSEAIVNFIRGEGGPDLDPSVIDGHWFDAETYQASGAFYNIKHARAQALQEVGDRIARFLKKAATGLNISGVILTGGGSEFLMPYIDTQLPVRISANPRRANVEGAYQMIAE